ncbi:YesL family protein [Lacticaseibacillus absianus]|uniref:YesL family protein n=1 Tax=Lacticaseibacillus absianus TaxID=2729623 RepID=UPI0015C830CE|nr:DUF624 domain-containing protein [Lacticaseibacillus absianus]
MLGRTTQNVFTRVFVMLILSLFFWVYTFAGLVILGLGPALRAVAELYQANRWEWRGYSFRAGWRQWRAEFWSVNAHTWGFLGILLFLGYNLYLSVQLHQAWIVFVQFVIIAAIVLTFSLGIFTLTLRAHYDIAFRDALKLALVQFFSNFYQLALFILATIATVLISLKWPGLIIFLSVGAYIVLADWLSGKMYARIDASIAP